jgi:hypothetical protein
MGDETGLPIAWCELATVFRSAEHLILISESKVRVLVRPPARSET